MNRVKREEWIDRPSAVRASRINLACKAADIFHKSGENIVYRGEPRSCLDAGIFSSVINLSITHSSSSLPVIKRRIAAFFAGGDAGRKIFSRREILYEKISICPAGISERGG